jgi:hypothetical protein
VYDKKIPFCVLGLVLWMMLFGQSLYITDVGDNIYTEYGVSAFTLGFVMLHIILLILEFMESVKLRKISTTPLSRRIGRAR